MTLPRISWNTPAMAPPEGVKPNFATKAALANALVIVNSIGVGLMMAVFLARFISKRIISKQPFDLSDGTLGLAVSGAIIYTVLSIYNTSQGFGQHLWNIRLMSLTSGRTMLFSLVEVVYVITMFLTKISLLLLFWRFFSIDRLSRRLIIIGFVVLTVITVPYLVIAALHVAECNGLKALSTSLCHQGQISTSNLVFGTLNVITDFYVLIVPILQLRTLHIKTKKKIGVMATFLTGFVASSMSIIRVGFIAKNFHNKDVLHTSAFMATLGSVEMKLAIICGCMAYMPALFRKGKSSFTTLYTFVSCSVLGRTNRSTEKMSLTHKQAYEVPAVPIPTKPQTCRSKVDYEELELPEFQRGPEWGLVVA